MVDGKPEGAGTDIGEGEEEYLDRSLRWTPRWWDWVADSAEKEDISIASLMRRAVVVHCEGIQAAHPDPKPKPPPMKRRRAKRLRASGEQVQA